MSISRTHPFPWSAVEHPGVPSESKTLVVDANGIVVLDCAIVGRTKAENEAAAKFVVDGAHTYHVQVERLEPLLVPPREHNPRALV